MQKLVSTLTLISLFYINFLVYHTFKQMFSSYLKVLHVI